MDPSTLTTFYVGVLLFLCLLPFIVGAIRGRIDLFEAIYPISFSYFLFFGFRAILLLTEPQATLISPNMALMNASEYLPLALRYSIAGVTAMLVGYYSGAGSRLASLLPRFRWMEGLSLSWNRVLLVFLGGACVQFYHGFWQTPSVYEGALGDLIGQLAAVGLYGLGLGLILHLTSGWRERTQWTPIVLGMMLFELIFVVVRTQRQNLVLLILILLMTWHYFKRRIPASRIILSGLLFACFLFPLSEQWRRVYFGSQQLEGPGLGVAYRMAFEKLRESESTGEYLRNSIIMFSNRLHGLDSLMLGLYKTPATIPFWKGETLTKFFAGTFIPRFLWKEKPRIYFSDAFGRDYWGLPPQFKAAIAVSQLGELYINYGLPGVLLGMLCLGALYRTLYVYLVVRRPHSLAVLVYIFALFNVSVIDRELAVTYGILVKRLVILLIVCAFVYQPARFRMGASR